MKEQISVELAKMEQAKEIHNLMRFVYDEITDKDTFVCDDLLYVEEHIQGKGFTVVAFDEQRKLVGCFLVDVPGNTQENLGFDIGLDVAQRNRVVHMDSAVVHPCFRGQGLQGKMLAFAETIIWERWVKDSALTFYLISTVSPDNPASYKTLERSGYSHVCTKEKYGGLKRRIYCKPFLEPEVPIARK